MPKKDFFPPLFMRNNQDVTLKCTILGEIDIFNSFFMSPWAVFVEYE